MRKSYSVNRRKFVKIATGCLAVVPTANAIAEKDAERPKLAEDDPQAAALGYLEDSTAVDVSKYPNHSDDQLCVNCALFQAEVGAEWGMCAIFPGKQVAANGWCAAYAAKPN